MAHHLKTGQLGEEVAANYLTILGFLVIDRNVRMKFGEIDIVARDPKGVLVFVEVKTLTRLTTLSPEDNMTRVKFHKLSRACSAYANSHSDLVDETVGYRIDLVAVIADPSLPLALGYSLFDFGKNNFAVCHYENIF